METIGENFERNNYDRRDNWGRGGDNQPRTAGVRNGGDRGGDPALRTNDRWQEPDKRENAFYGGNNGRTIPRGGKSTIFNQQTPSANFAYLWHPHINGRRRKKT